MRPHVKRGGFQFSGLGPDLFITPTNDAVYNCCGLPTWRLVQPPFESPTDPKPD